MQEYFQELTELEFKIAKIQNLKTITFEPYLGFKDNCSICLGEWENN
jgi:hypothetical protein